MSELAVKRGQNAMVRIAVVFSLSLLASCTTWASAPQGGSRAPSGGYGRFGAYLGSSEVDDGTDTLDGFAGGGRVEIGGVVNRHFQFGGRVNLGGASVDANVGGMDLDADTFDVFVEPVARAYFGLAETRPFVEVFGGYMFSDIDFSAAGSSVDGDADGPTFGAGLGVQFDLGGQGGSIAVGIEVRRSELDADVAGVSGDLDRTDILGTVNYITYW